MKIFVGRFNGQCNTKNELAAIFFVGYERRMTEQPKRRRGRPEGATLTEEIRIRMEPELLAIVDQSAQLAGVTRSALIRHAVGVYLGDAGIEPRQPGRRPKGEG